MVHRSDKMKFNKKVAVATIALAITLNGCQLSTELDNPNENEPVVEVNIDNEQSEKNIDNNNEGETQEGTEEAIEESNENQPESENNDETEEDIDQTLSKEDILKYQPNELGRVMVIMYHSLGSQEGYYVTTPDILRDNLRTLYEKGYVLVPLKDFVNNTMDVPLGKTPVVLTFDDGHSSNFKILEENDYKSIDPDSAVGIINDFYEKHPDFNRHASFFLNSNHSFSQNHLEEYKLNYLIEHGYDIGNHTYGHEDLSVLDQQAIEGTIGKNKQQIENILKDYTVNTLALPFGKRPKDETLKNALYTGVYEGTTYENIAILNVGWNPTYSPLHQKFNFKSINRVQSGSGDFQLSYWIEYFDKNPDKRYISDGLVQQITVPKSYEEYLDKERLDNQEVIMYERESND